MTTKTCSKCGKTKFLDEFQPRLRGCFGVSSQCKACMNSRKRRYQRTFMGWVLAKWTKLNRRTINGSHPNWKDTRTRSYLNKGIRLELTKEEFIRFAADNWQDVINLWAAGETPSIERIDPEGHYAVANIEIISLRENLLRANQTTP